ncbi:unnamed protein product [Psylliodes chrysocephalus]|uniref:Uncharacterized protein n=1 Tax=Psylliodes chrysocephalus TaxID=3402493 RepID=A0A9P0GJP8_9CUCU|nr:unnamed protein product [Psylliodes chrysocephala]
MLFFITYFICSTLSATDAEYEDILPFPLSVIELPDSIMNEKEFIGHNLDFEVIDHCVHSSGVDVETLIHMIEYMRVPNEHEVKDFLFCFARNQGIQHENGEIEFDMLFNFLISIDIGHEWNIRDPLENCIENNYDGSENAYLTLKCIMEEYSILNLIPTWWHVFMKYFLRK